MRVKPYAIRFPSRNARHTALPAPGGCMSTSGCSCRYRSSLRAWSGGPGGTSCTGQYRYPVSGQRNGFLKSPATRHRRNVHECVPPSWTLPVPMTNPSTTFASAAVARQHPYATKDRWLPPSAGQAVPGADWRQACPPSCRIAALTAQILMRRPAYSFMAQSAQHTLAAFRRGSATDSLMIQVLPITRFAVQVACALRLYQPVLIRGSLETVGNVLDESEFVNARGGPQTPARGQMSNIMLTAMIRDTPETSCASSYYSRVRRPAASGKRERQQSPINSRFGAPAPRSGLDRSPAGGI